MKARLMGMVLVAVCLIGSCTGCDSELSSRDVTQDRAILTAERWVAQESYTVDSELWGVLCIVAVDDAPDDYQVTMYANPTSIRSIHSGTIAYEGSAVIMTTLVGGISANYSLKITQGNDGATVLTLTDSLANKMFYSPENTLAPRS